AHGASKRASSVVAKAVAVSGSVVAAVAVAAVAALLPISPQAASRPAHRASNRGFSRRGMGDYLAAAFFFARRLAGLRAGGAVLASPCRVSSDSISCSSALEHTPSSSASLQPSATI